MSKILTYTCTTCGGENVSFDAYARWSVELQDCELSGTYDDSHCHDCDGECKTAEREITDATRYTVQKREPGAHNAWVEVEVFGDRAAADNSVGILGAVMGEYEYRVVPVWVEGG